MVTGTNIPGATLIPNARGLSGHNLHTWTGGWGTVNYWNAFVAVLELHGIGTFFDERLDDASQFPIAAAARLGHVSVDPDTDQVTGKLAALHFYQLSLPSVAAASWYRLRSGCSSARRRTVQRQSGLQQLSPRAAVDGAWLESAHPRRDEDRQL